MIDPRADAWIVTMEPWDPRVTGRFDWYSSEMAKCDPWDWQFPERAVFDLAKEFYKYFLMTTKYSNVGLKEKKVKRLWNLHCRLHMNGVRDVTFEDVKVQLMRLGVNCVNGVFWGILLHPSWNFLISPTCICADNSDFCLSFVHPEQS